MAQYTTIPVPKEIARVVADGEIVWLGPYIIMEFVQGNSLNEVILDQTDKIKSEISEATLRKIYRQIADILLQPSQPARFRQDWFSDHEKSTRVSTAGPSATDQ